MLQSESSFVVTNLAVASSLLTAFYSWRVGDLDYEEVYLDILTGRHVPVRRELVDRK